MAKHATGTFKVTSWDENTYEQLEGDAKLTRARITQDFSGDLQGGGTWDVLMCYAPDGTAIYTGLVRVIGKLNDRAGSMVLQTNGGFDGNEARWTWSVVPGSGTEQLSGVHGEGAVVAPHGSTGSFSLDFDVDAVGG
jgi:hypothetical protein